MAGKPTHELFESIMKFNWDLDHLVYMECEARAKIAAEQKRGKLKKFVALEKDHSGNDEDFDDMNGTS